MIKDDVKHLNHNVKKLSSINGTKEKLLLSSPMVTMSDKRTKISTE